MWSELVIGRVKAKRVVEVTREMVRGTLAAAMRQITLTHGGTMLNTASIERFNGTLRERLAVLTRRCHHAAQHLSALRHGMYLIGCTYNLCWPHHVLRVRNIDQPGHPSLG